VRFQSPDGDCLDSYKRGNGYNPLMAFVFQSPDGDYLDSYALKLFLDGILTPHMFQSPDGDCLIFYSLISGFISKHCLMRFSPLTGIV
jgi:hypothetical protein